MIETLGERGTAAPRCKRHEERRGIAAIVGASPRMRPMTVSPGAGNRARLLLVTLAAAVTAQVVIGAVWWLRNLEDIPAYGDTSEYLRLASSLHVDQYRTILYPAMLREVQNISGSAHISFVPLLYIVQTVLALLAALWCGATLWDILATTASLSWLRTIRTSVRRAVVSVAALFVVTTPLVLHFALH